MSDHVEGKDDGDASNRARPEEKHAKSRPKNKKRAFDNAAYEEVNVMVTGFQPLAGKSVNPAWLVANSLPPVLPVTAAHPSRIRITVHYKPLPIVYKTLETALESLVSNGQIYHLILHLGVAKDSTVFKLERIGRSAGYETLDGDGKLPDESTQPVYWSQNVHLGTSARMEDVFVRWQSEHPEANLSLSSDGGQYVCEYLFYSSLSYLRYIGNNDIPWNDRTTVEFLHVPDSSDATSIDKGRQIVISLISSLIDSRRQRDGDFDEEGHQLE